MGGDFFFVEGCTNGVDGILKVKVIIVDVFALVTIVLFELIAHLFNYIEGTIDGKGRLRIFNKKVELADDLREVFADGFPILKLRFVVVIASAPLRS